MKHVFDFQEPYYILRSETNQFRRENIKTTHYGIWYPVFQISRTQDMAIEAENIKHCKYLQEFKRLIKVWKREACLAEYAKSTLQILVSFD